MNDLSMPFGGVLGASAKPLTRQYDALFRKYGHGIPVPFLRALAKKESSFNPKEVKGSYWGLLQVGWRPSASAKAEGKDDSVVGGYNSREGTHYTREDLLTPSVNIAVATDLIRRIVQSYERNHPNVPNMQEDWSNPEFVRLVVAGWNSGYSEGGGVGKVADYLEANGIPVTHANVFANAEAARATKHLQNPKKEKWQRQVVDLFYDQPDALEPWQRVLALFAPLPFVFPWDVSRSGLGASSRASTGGTLGATGIAKSPGMGALLGGTAALGLTAIVGWIAGRGR